MPDKPRVFKNRFAAIVAGHPLLALGDVQTDWSQPWVVVGPLGVHHFPTWREAIQFALQPSVTYNRPRGYDPRHEENVWRAKHGLEMI